MVPRMIADGFSIDVYCAYINLPPAEELIDESERNRSVSHNNTITRIPARTRNVARHRQSTAYILPRLVWLAIGPAIMMVLAVLKLESHSGQPGQIDFAFFASVIGILIVRWVTWLAGDRCDSFGGKAGFQSLLGFTTIVALAATGLWTLAMMCSG